MTKKKRGMMSRDPIRLKPSTMRWHIVRIIAEMGESKVGYLTQSMREDPAVGAQNSTIHSLRSLVATCASEKPSWILRVKRGVYDLHPTYRDRCLEILAQHQAGPPEDMADGDSAKDLPSALEIVKRHRAARIERIGRDYSGKDIHVLRYHVRGLDRLDLAERPDEPMTFRDAQLLCTALGLPDLRSDLEQADARSRGEDHIREWDLSLLMPGTSPYPEAPVSFDALVDALGLDRRASMRSLEKSFRLLKTEKISTKGRPRKLYWLSGRQAKEFALSAQIPAKRKEPIVDYFIRREEESEDNRKAIAEERTSLAGSSHIEALLGSVVSAVSTMTRLIEENHRRQLRLEESQEAFKATVQKQVEHVVEERDEALLLKAEAEQARTERIEKLKADCPYIGEQVARWAGIWASSGKPHASAMRAIGYMLGLDGLDCIKDDDESGEHRFTRFNRQAVNMIKAWKREHIKAGRNSIDIPRVAGGCWHVWLVQPADINLN